MGFSLQCGYGSTHGTYMAGLVRTFVVKLIEVYCLTADTFVFVTELNLLDDLLAHFWQADISIHIKAAIARVWCTAGSHIFCGESTVLEQLQQAVKTNCVRTIVAN
jgi:hypothetical protein